MAIALSILDFPLQAPPQAFGPYQRSPGSQQANSHPSAANSTVLEAFYASASCLLLSPAGIAGGKKHTQVLVMFSFGHIRIINYNYIIGTMCTLVQFRTHQAYWSDVRPKCCLRRCTALRKQPIACDQPLPPFFWCFSMLHPCDAFRAFPRIVGPYVHICAPSRARGIRRYVSEIPNDCPAQRSKRCPRDI